MEQTDYVDRVKLMARIERPLTAPKSDHIFTRLTIMIIGMIIGMTLITALKACDPLPVPVPHYAMRLPQ